MAEGDLISLSADELRSMDLDQLCEFAAVLGVSTEGVETPAQALTRIVSVAYAAEV